MNKYLIFISLCFIAVGCKKDCPPPEWGDLSDILYSPQSYDLVRPPGFPSMIIPADNELTNDGVELGRHLFYDPILSADSSMSCASCHFPNMSFTDGQATSVGIDGVSGTRSSMALHNAGYFEHGLFWDGRVTTLEEQALIPVEDEIELHDDWGNVVEKFRAHPTYPMMFRKAFGIEDKTEISKELAAKALAQFERTLLSYNSRYDKIYIREEGAPSDSEARGFAMYFDLGAQGSGLPDAECGHCHNAPTMTTGTYHNNGLDEAPTLEDFTDLGLGAITQDTFDNGKFRAPTLRNIALTAPYMHDGRFQTLEEVLDHYDSGGHPAPNLDPLIRPLNLTDSQKEDIINFLHMLTDTTFTANPEYQNPF